MTRIWFLMGSLFGGFGVALSALAAHAKLSPPDPALQDALHSAATLLLVHAPALLAIAALRPGRGPAIDWAASAIASGVFLFAATISLHAFAGIYAGPLAPIGGSVAILGWAGLAATAWRQI